MSAKKDAPIFDNIKTVLISSNAPWANTGYGKQTKHLLKILQGLGIDVKVHGFYGCDGASLNAAGAEILPSFFDPHGRDMIVPYTNHFAPDLLITIYDAWVYESVEGMEDLPWLAWFPVDGFAMIAANKSFPSRKAFPEVLMAFARYLEEVDDTALLYLHTVASKKADMVGMALLPMLQQLGLASDHAVVENVTFPNEVSLATGISDESMAAILNAADVLVSPSWGEGFGLPIVEAQACGTPVITQNCTSMTELTVNGICIPAGQRFWIPKLEYWWRAPDVAKIFDAMVKLTVCRNTSTAAAERQMGLLAMQNHYSLSELKKNWLELLLRIDGEAW